MIYKYAGKLIPNRFGQQNCCHGRIHAPRQSTQNLACPDFIFYFCNGILHKRVHFPASTAATYIPNKIAKHLCSFQGMQYFRMKLDRIQFSCTIFCRSNGAVCSMGWNSKTGRRLRDVIRMAHPADSIGTYTCKYGWFTIYTDFCFTIFLHWRFFHMPPQHMHHKLRTIT